MDNNKIIDLTEVLNKAKRAEIGEVRNGRKKVAEGEWVSVNQNEKMSGKEMTIQQHQSQAQEHFDAAMKYSEILNQLEQKVQDRLKIDRKYKTPQKAQQLINEVKTKVKFHKRQYEIHQGQGKQNWKQGAGKDPAKKYQTQRSGQAQAKVDQKKNKEKMNKGYLELDNLLKSVVSMDHQSTAIETANQAIELTRGPDKWLRYFYDQMKDFEYGDTPRELLLDNNYILSLVKVDDGQYSGYVKKTDGDIDLTDFSNDGSVNRVEKMTIPAIVQFCIAKEYISPQELLEPEEELSEALNAVIVEELPAKDIPNVVDGKITLAQELVSLLNKLIS